MSGNSQVLLKSSSGTESRSGTHRLGGSVRSKCKQKPLRECRVHALNYLISRLSFEDQLLIIDDVFDSGHSLEAVLAELRRRCRRNLANQIRIATVYYKPERNRSSLKPDYYVRSTDNWLVFPHELHGLTREEILEHKPVDESFFQN